MKYTPIQSSLPDSTHQKKSLVLLAATDLGQDSNTVNKTEPPLTNPKKPNPPKAASVFPNKIEPLRWDDDCAVFDIEQVHNFGEPCYYGNSRPLLVS